MKIAIIVLSVLAGLALLIWLGLQINSRPFSQVSRAQQPIRYVPLPEGLPAPVERFYRQVYGEQVPVIETAIITGRGDLRVNGITFPARFRFTHQSGDNYRHYIEATFWGLPLLKVNEHFLDGSSRFELPFGVSQGPQVDQGANLALWAEAIWMPSVWVTDPRASWQAVDAQTAILSVPYQEQREQFVVRFDPQTGLIHLMESMRYKGEESQSKTLWLNQVVEWDLSGEMPVPVVTAVTWFDEGTPWALLKTEDVVFNREVDAYIRAKGP